MLETFFQKIFSHSIFHSFSDAKYGEPWVLGCCCSAPAPFSPLWSRAWHYSWTQGWSFHFLSAINAASFPFFLSLRIFQCFFNSSQPVPGSLASMTNMWTNVLDGNSSSVQCCLCEHHCQWNSKPQLGQHKPLASDWWCPKSDRRHFCTTPGGDDWCTDVHRPPHATARTGWRVSCDGVIG